jgi:hypothetical protein
MPAVFPPVASKNRASKGYLARDRVGRSHRRGFHETDLSIQMGACSVQVLHSFKLGLIPLARTPVPTARTYTAATAETT